MSQTDDLREALARAVHREADDGSVWALMPDEHRECWRQSADRIRAQFLAPILAQVSALQAEVERLQKVEGERGRLERALGVSVAVLDRAAGEGIMFLPGDDGSPEMDAADACEIISTVIEAEIDGPVWRALLATGWKRLAPSDNPLTETKEGSEHV